MLEINKINDAAVLHLYFAFIYKMKEGRRTSTIKATYEAFKNNDFQLAREFSISRESTGYPSTLASTLTQTLPTSATDSRSGRKNK